MPPARVGKGRLPRDAYILVIRQAPQVGKALNGKEKDRKPIDPPPIVQLQIRDYNDPAQNYLQSPYYMCVCALWHATEDKPVDEPSLAGTLVSSLHRLKGTDNHDAGFFVFPDVSVKAEGDFRLKFILWELKEGLTESLQSVISRPFKVHPAKTFPGLAESTFLTRSFSDQGVRLRIRKETRTSIKRSVTEAENGPMPNTQREGAAMPGPTAYGQQTPYPGQYQGDYQGLVKRQKSTGGQSYPDNEAWQYSQQQQAAAAAGAYAHPSNQPVSGYYQEGVSGPPQMEFFRGPGGGDNAMGQHNFYQRPPMAEYQHMPPQVAYGGQPRPDGSNGMHYPDPAYGGVPGHEHPAAMSPSSGRSGEVRTDYPGQGGDQSNRGYRYAPQGGAVPPNTLPPITTSSHPTTSSPAFSTYNADGRYPPQPGVRQPFSYAGQGYQVPTNYT